VSDALVFLFRLGQDTSIVKFPGNQVIGARREANLLIHGPKNSRPGFRGLLRDVDCRLTLAELFQRFLIVLTAFEA
jgi:hypothetical protein